MLSVQIATSGVMIMHFNNISLISIVANFISSPIASFAYCILFITVAISFVLPFANICVYLFQFVMQIVVKLVHMLASVKMLTLSHWQGIVLSVASIPTMFVTSDYLLCTSKVKNMFVPRVWSLLFILLLL